MILDTEISLAVTLYEHCTSLLTVLSYKWTYDISINAINPMTTTQLRIFSDCCSQTVWPRDISSARLDQLLKHPDSYAT